MSELMQLIYASRATFAPSRESAGIEPKVARILAQSRKNNPKRAIGGVLYYGDGCFFQCLEGEKSAVDLVFERIKLDPRHTAVKVLASFRVDRRTFEDWSMKYVPVERDVAELLKNHGMKEFDPYRFDAAMIDEMLVLLGGAVDPTGANDLSAYLQSGEDQGGTNADHGSPRRLSWLPVALGAAALLVATAALLVSLGLIG